MIILINEEVSRQVIAVEKKALHMTSKEILKIMKMLLKKAGKQKNGLKDFIASKKPVNVKDLVKKGKVETLELNDIDLKNLKRYLKKSGVKFSIKKDLTTGNKIVFFEAKDEKIMEQAFKDTVAKFTGKERKRESVIEKLNYYKEIVKNAPQKDKVKEKHQEQSL